MVAMARVKLGEYIKLCDERNRNRYGLENLQGISIQKKFIESKADMDGVPLSSYIVVKPDYFSYVTITSRNGEKITLAYNDTQDTYIVSSSYIVFYVSKPDELDSEYLFMYFNRPEFDRYSRFNSWGSAREAFSWDDMCDIEIDLPDIEVQRKFVAVYKAMVANQQAYQQGLEDLKLTCDAYIENLRREMKCEAIGTYLERRNEKNSNKKNNKVLGLSTEKKFRVAQSRVNLKELANYKIVREGEFAFVPTTDTWKVLAFALNADNGDIVVSPIYEVFATNKQKLLPEYLAMWLSRKEFDRYARFFSWGSARENFLFEDMCEVQIPIPFIEIQTAIVNIYKAYIMRREINERLKAQIKDICRVLIKGASNGF